MPLATFARVLAERGAMTITSAHLWEGSRSYVLAERTAMIIISAHPLEQACCRWYKFAQSRHIQDV